MNRTLILLLVLLFVLLNLKSIEKFDNVGHKRYVLNDGKDDYELVSYNQLSHNIQQHLIKNFDVLNINKSLNDMNALTDRANGSVRIPPENDIIFAIKTKDLADDKLVHLTSLVGFNRSEEPIYVSDASSVIREYQQPRYIEKDDAQVYIIDNLLSITVKQAPINNNLELKKFVVEDNKVSGKYIKLKEVIIGYKTLYKLELVDKETNIKIRSEIF